MTGDKRLRAGLLLFRAAAFALCVLAAPVPSRGQSGGPAQGEWYLSNSAGMALERVPSRFAALRQPYCLLIEEPGVRALPALLAPYYREPWIVERRVLYKDGEESRAQWILRDGGGVTRLVAVLAEPGIEPESGAESDSEVESGAESGPESDTAGVPNGFIELYGANGLVESERHFFGGGEETLVEYHYRNIPSGTRDILIRAETRRKLTDVEGNERQEDLYTDYYRYTRNYSLRAIERIFHQAAAETAAESADAVVAAEAAAESADAVVAAEAAAESANAVVAAETAAESAGAVVAAETGTASVAADTESTVPGTAEPDAEPGLTDAEAVTAEPAEPVPSQPPRATLRFPRRSLDSKDDESFVSPSTAYGSQFLEDAQAEAPGGVVYETDERGRVLGETRQGEGGEVIGELRNEWSGNRLSRVVYTEGEDEMVTEYEYDDDGDRIAERNYRNGVLERAVRISGDREEEELYMNGELVLRSLWEGGRKISEERVRRAGPARGGES
ncbi:MAG: hypothetical protein LBO76_06535 [Treponema sp.]|nr:hypothetical protein [Treponema sp.]